MDYEDQDDLMPEIIEATQEAITSEEEETEEEQENIIKEDIEVNDMFEEKKEEKIIDEKPEPLKVCRVKDETEKKEESEEEETPETEPKKIKPKPNEKAEKRKKQLEQLRMMRERKKQLAEERAIKKKEEVKEEVEEEPTPKPIKKKTTPRPKSPIKKTVSFEADELEDFMENIAVRSIQRYKAQKEAKKNFLEKSSDKKDVEPPKPEPVKENPINNIIKPQWTEEDLYAGFF